MDHRFLGSSIPSVKNLKIETDNYLCGSSFSTDLYDNQTVVNSEFNDDKSFEVTISFFDSSCSVSGTVGNKIAKYSMRGVYSVTNAIGDVIMTVTDSSMTVMAGDYPVAARKMVDWMNNYTDLEGSFSTSQNTTLPLSTGPTCKSGGAKEFTFMADGSSIADTEEAINRLVAKSN